MSDEIHDTSRVDGYMRSRQRVAFLSAVWRPLLAGAAGAGLIIAAVAVAQPRFVFRDIEVPRITMRDVTADRVTPRDVTINNLIPKDIVVEIPRIVTTPAEKAFVESKAFADAPMRGRIVPSRHEGSLSFDDGQDYVPTKPGMAADAAPFVGDFGMCSRIAGDEEHFHCVALHDGKIVPVRQTPIDKQGRRATEGPHALASTLQKESTP